MDEQDQPEEQKALDTHGYLRIDLQGRKDIVVAAEWGPAELKS